MKERILLCLALARLIRRVPSEQEWVRTKGWLNVSITWDAEEPYDAIKCALESEIWFQCPRCGDWCLTVNGVKCASEGWGYNVMVCCDDCAEDWRTGHNFNPHREWGTY